MVEKTYVSAVGLLEDTWKYGTKKQKEALLKSRGLNKSWAKTKSVNEMVKRGGGVVAHSLKDLMVKYLQKKGGSVTIDWDKRRKRRRRRR